MRVQPIPLVGGSYQDETRPWSQQDTVNYLPCLAERPGTRSGEMLKTPPGMYPYLEIPGTDTESGVIPSPPVRGTHNAEGRFFAVIGSTLYQVSSAGVAIPLGSVPGIGRVAFDHNQISLGNQVMVVNGSAGYVYNTRTGDFERITDPGFPGASTVKFIGGYMVGIEPQGRFAFNSAVADALNYNTLDRFTSEYAPDRLVGQAAVGGDLLLLSQNTGEFFSITANNPQPFRTKKIYLDKGCAGAFTIVEADNSVFWLGSDGYFYRLNGYAAARISTRPIEQAIRGLNWSQAFGFVWEDSGHTVIYWTFPDGRTWGWDVAQNEWHRRESYGLDRWRANTMTRWNDEWYAGDFQSGRIWRMDWDYILEGDQEFVSYRTMAVIHDNQNAVIIPRLELVMDTGQIETTPGTFPEQPIGPTVSGEAPDGSVLSEYPGFSYIVTPGDASITSVELRDGTLPAGLTFSDGDISAAQPTESGAFPLVIRATDANGLFYDHADEFEVMAFIYVAMGSSQEGVWLSSDLDNWSAMYTLVPSVGTGIYNGASVGGNLIMDVIQPAGSVAESYTISPSPPWAGSSVPITVAQVVQSGGSGLLPSIMLEFSPYVVAWERNGNKTFYWVTSDNGATYTQVTCPGTLRARGMARMDSGRWIGYFGQASTRTLYYSDVDVPDQTSDWVSIGTATGIWGSQNCMAAGGGYGYYISSLDRVFRTATGGPSSWTQVFDGNGVFGAGELFVSPTTGTLFVLGSNSAGFIWYSRDAGTSFTTVQFSSDTTVDAYRMKEIDGRLIIDSDRDRFFICDDDGDTWVQKNAPFSGFGNACTIVPITQAPTP